MLIQLSRHEPVSTTGLTPHPKDTLSLELFVTPPADIYHQLPVSIHNHILVLVQLDISFWLCFPFVTWTVKDTSPQDRVVVPLSILTVCHCRLMCRPSVSTNSLAITDCWQPLFINVLTGRLPMVMIINGSAIFTVSGWRENPAQMLSLSCFPVLMDSISLCGPTPCTYSVAFAF